MRYCILIRMTGRIQLLFISSFLMGMFAGAYFFVSFFAPLIESPDSGLYVDAQQDLIIEGIMYGGCERMNACANFQLVNGRDYHYTVSTDTEVQTGRLHRTFAEGIKASLSDDTLYAASGPENMNSCSSYVDGIDYHYTIIKEGQRYELDTCTTALAYNQSLQELFLDIWYTLENPEAIESEPFEFNPLDMFWDRFHNPPQN